MIMSKVSKDVKFSSVREKVDLASSQNSEQKLMLSEASQLRSALQDKQREGAARKGKRHKHEDCVWSQIAAEAGGFARHQSKGLEFTRVFLPQLVQNVLPSFLVLKGGDPAQLAEERRLLYVAMTRAKRRLYLSWHGRNANGYQAEPSTFLGELLGEQ